MKIKHFLAASTFALATAFPLYAQTASTGIPAVFADIPAIQQVDAQLSAQGYTITDITKNADGSYSILSKSTTGELRLITIDTDTGSVTDTVTAGVSSDTTGIKDDGTFENDSNETSAMETLESGNDGGKDGGKDNDHNGGNDSGNDNGNDNGSSDGGSSDGGSHDGGSDGGNDSDGGSDTENGND